MPTTKEAKILSALSSKKWVHMRVLNKICFSYGQRIFDLRRKGYKIDTIQLGIGEFAYLLFKTNKKT